MKKALFFDFDGVILDSVNIKTEAFRTMFSQYGDDIAQKIVDYHQHHGGISRYKKFEWAYSELLGEKLTPEKKDELGVVFSRLVLESVLNAPFISGVIQFIQHYRDDYLLFVVSGTPHEELENVLMHKGIFELFDSVHGSPESKVEIVEKLSARHGINKKASWFFGDAGTDLKAARHHGMRFVLVKSGDNGDLVPESDIAVDNYRGFRLPE